MLWLVGVLACGGGAVASAPPQTSAELPEPVVELPPPPPEPVVEPLPTEGPFRRELAAGLVVGAYAPPDIPDVGYSRPPAEEVAETDRRIFVVTVDPALHELRYLSLLDDAVQPGHKTATEWVEAYGLEVAFNPGMFEPRYEPTGYTRSGAFVPQTQVRSHRLYRGWFVSGETMAVIDRVPPPATSGKYSRYSDLPSDVQARFDAADLVSQSLPILRDGKAAYPARKNQWSELAYGADGEGRLVVVFSRYPYEMREFGARIAALDLGIDGLIHGEGGPEASLVVRVGGVELVQMGSYETGFYDDRNTRLWALPAVLGVRARSAKPAVP